MAQLNGYPVVFCELTDTVDAITVKRTFRPGVRKGKRAGQLTKVYVLAKSYQVPSASCLLVNGHIVIHPAIWAQVEAELEKLDAPQMAYGWM